MTLTTIAPEIPRDRYSRPLVVPPEGGKAVPYTRCTTYIDVISDKFNLQQWEKRMVAIGLSQRPDLLLSVSAHRDDKQALTRICNDAKEAAAASAAATTGTALHALTERLDRGLDLGVVPDAYLADIAAYQSATEPLTATHIEQFCVLDALRIGGTPDRVIKHDGKRYIADIKTGSIEYDTLKIAAQLAVYARSHTYDHVTGERGEHGAELDRGLIIHLPAGTGTCELVWVDLLAGWDAVRVARDVRDMRTRKYRDLTTPFNAPPPLTVVPEPDPAPDLPALIAKCTDADAVRTLWALNTDSWTQEHTNLAAAHIAALEAGQP